MLNRFGKVYFDAFHYYFDSIESFKNFKMSESGFPSVSRRAHSTPGVTFRRNQDDNPDIDESFHTRSLYENEENDQDEFHDSENGGGDRDHENEPDPYADMPRIRDRSAERTQQELRSVMTSLNQIRQTVERVARTSAPRPAPEMPIHRDQTYVRDPLRIQAQELNRLNSTLHDQVAPATSTPFRGTIPSSAFSGVKSAEKILHGLSPFNPSDERADIRMFLKNLERIWDHGNWSETQFVFLARQKVTGNALRALEGARVESWADMKRILLEQFGIPQSVAEERFRQLRRKRNQSVSEYVNEFRYLHSMCIPSDVPTSELDAYNRIAEKRIVRQFIEGLTAPLSDRVYSREPVSLTQAIQIALYEENSPSYRQNKSVEIHNVQNNLICAYCKKLGHRIDECRIRPPRSFNGNLRSSYQPKDSSFSRYNSGRQGQHSYRPSPPFRGRYGTNGSNRINTRPNSSYSAHRQFTAGQNSQPPRAPPIQNNAAGNSPNATRS